MEMKTKLTTPKLNVKSHMQTIIGCLPNQVMLVQFTIAFYGILYMVPWDVEVLVSFFLRSLA